MGIAKDSLKTSKLIRPGCAIFSKGADFFQQDKSSVIAAKSIVNIYIVFKLSTKSISSSNALKNCLFGATEVKKPNNTQILKNGNIADMVLPLIKLVNLPIMIVVKLEI